MTLIADDHFYIKARMEELALERAQAPAERAMQTAVENYLNLDNVTTTSSANLHVPYLGWDIYAPVNPNSVNG